MNLPLRLALTAHPGPDYRTAHDCNINPSKLSQIVNEITPPTKEQRIKIADVLKRNVEEIFPPKAHA